MAEGTPRGVKPRRADERVERFASGQSPAPTSIPPIVPATQEPGIPPMPPPELVAQGAAPTAPPPLPAGSPGTFPLASAFQPGSLPGAAVPLQAAPVGGIAGLLGGAPAAGGLLGLGGPASLAGPSAGVPGVAGLSAEGMDPQMLAELARRILMSGAGV